MPGIVGLKDLVETYFYSSQWLWIFVGSIVYLFLRMNAARKRAFLTALAFFFLFVNSFVIEKFTALGENGTFYRHLWAIPVVVIVGIAVDDLIKIIPKWYLKIPVIVAFTVGFWFVNCQEYIRLRDLPLSTDGKMVSQDVIELSEGFERIKKEIDKNTIFVVCANQATELGLYSGALDVSNSSILNDSEHSGEVELTSENPDVSYIISTCCSKGIDYVITRRDESIREVFSQQGYNPVFESKSFLVYRCYGFKGFAQDKNNWGQIIRKSYYNENGEPDKQTAGYCRIDYIYDNKGNKIKELFWGTDEELCETVSGYAEIRYQYNNQRRCVKETYYNKYGDLIDLPVGYACIIRTYTMDGLLESQRYTDKEERPVLVNGCFETRYEYNDKKLVIRESYYNSDSSPMMRTDLLYASKIIHRHENHWVLGERYFNTNGKLTICAYGYAGFDRELDEKGNLLKETYLDINEQPIN